MKYYEISLLRSSAPNLTYRAENELSIGSVVMVSLKTTVKEAMVVSEVEKPKFETAEIISVSDKVYTNEQMEIAKFISEYYFSSFSEAISIFIPYFVGADPHVRPVPGEEILNLIQRVDTGVDPYGTSCLAEVKQYAAKSLRATSKQRQSPTLRSHRFRQN